MSTIQKIIETGVVPKRRTSPKKKDIRKFSRKWVGKKTGFKLQRKREITTNRFSKRFGNDN